MAFAKGARMNGATIAEGVNVTEFRTANLRGTGTSKVLGITTEDGTQIDADYVVLCGGQWSRQMAKTAKINVPLHSCEHFYGRL